MSIRRLLLADDSITIQKVVNLTFADEGIEVLVAKDGEAALAKFTENSPDLVMADVNLPGLDGYEFCEIIKQNVATSKIPVILLVGTFEPFDESRAQLARADGYLTKPFQSIRQLVGKVTTLLDGEEHSESSENSTEIAESDALPTAFREEDVTNAAQVEENPPGEKNTSEKKQPSIEKKSAPRVLDFDEFKLLEIPPFAAELTEGGSAQVFVENFASEIMATDENAATDAAPATKGLSESKTSPKNAAGEYTTAKQLTLEDVSPELLEAIADRVIEKLSGKLKE